jgi:hypothetical protein
MLGVLILEPKQLQSLNQRSSATMSRKFGRDGNVILDDYQAGKTQVVNVERLVFLEGHCRTVRTATVYTPCTVAR